MNSEKQLRWDRHFLNLALEHAKMSKDPSTKVGAVIVGPDLEVRSVGYNGFPRGIEDTDMRLDNREAKLRLTVHAELNAILAAARVGIPLKGCRLYLVPISTNSNFIYGGPPCVRCIVEIIQAGITEIVSYHKSFSGTRWKEDEGSGGIDLAEALLKEAGIIYREIPLD